VCACFHVCRRVCNGMHMHLCLRGSEGTDRFSAERAHLLALCCGYAGVEGGHDLTPLHDIDSRQEGRAEELSWPVRTVTGLHVPVCMGLCLTQDVLAVLLTPQPSTAAAVHPLPRQAYVCPGLERRAWGGLRGHWRACHTCCCCLALGCGGQGHASTGEPGNNGINNRCTQGRARYT
jgi:hypothetical protein